MTKPIMIALSIYLVSSSPALAYLDPGTGSLVLQGIIAAIATVSVSISLGWRNIKNSISSAYNWLFKRAGNSATGQHEPSE